MQMTTVLHFTLTPVIRPYILVFLKCFYYDIGVVSGYQTCQVIEFIS